MLPTVPRTKSLNSQTTCTSVALARYAILEIFLHCQVVRFPLFLEYMLKQHNPHKEFELCQQYGSRLHECTDLKSSGGFISWQAADSQVVSDYVRYFLNQHM